MPLSNPVQRPDRTGALLLWTTRIMDKEKECKHCKQLKPLSEFYIDKKMKDNYAPECRECRIERSVEWKVNNRELYNERAKKYSRKWEKNNTARVRETNNKWRRDNPDKVKKMSAIYYKKKRAKIEERVNDSVRAMIRQSLRGKKNGRHWETLVGYKLKDLMVHLQKLFDERMTWSNYGEWHVDHIIPRSYFQFNSCDGWEFRYCWSLDNLQPLWSKDNLSKGNKILNGN